MKKSWIHYLQDILIFAVTPIFITLPTIYLLIKNEYIDISDSVLSAFISSFTGAKIISMICFIIATIFVFWPLKYCLYLGNQRELISDSLYKALSEWLPSVAFATCAILIATLVFNEIQISVLTSWVAFIVIFFPFLKLKVHNGNKNSLNNIDNEKNE